ncbi:winged helix-turn-helix domain-containing protein [Actinomadura sp. ATCC 31491]|uniref:Winged helix-turn-helix domain-containing protein n=1 Tax=Actinomadura luzonensis TaxID=2805427 RepID=A0ABT0FJ75_9ACTN|nr:winged helix-turn-helix domain-containing protein [Actinomadura luzonensis]MCK2212360.1 winged helix-turn-helix domain-containing protein [Actinomadura luzonensis]
MGTRFGVLGALEVVRDGVPLAVPAPKQRIALATLLLRAGRHVSLDQLAERMWDGREAPRDARGAVQTHIGRLRRTLRDRGDERQLIRTAGEGYVLRLAAVEDLDVAVFHDLVARARRAGQAGWPIAEARQGLDRLTAYHLIHTRGPGRYAFHDLLRLYAAEHAAPRRCRPSGGLRQPGVRRCLAGGRARLPRRADPPRPPARPRRAGLAADGRAARSSE